MEKRKLFNSNRLKKYLKKSSARNSSFVIKNLCHPEFPLYFVLRNLCWLKNEHWWTALSPRARRAQVIRIIQERIAVFSVVREWRKRRGNPLAATEATRAGNRQAAAEGDTAPSYCNKCGLCCEVASGMPDFPLPGMIPPGWREIFANGLGQGHRFCPFLWEDHGVGSSCSIYPFRSNPCRLFGFEECDFFWKSPEPEYVSDEKKLLLMGRWLARLVNACQLPLAGSYITAKRPELLKLDRV